ncbi:MAG TPA: hypothetical protein PLH16_04975 [Candidatus Omnitrophota bacterium]|nr:hypothetical protein [Candidatus Omnitrophota bacterium]
MKRYLPILVACLILSGGSINSFSQQTTASQAGTISVDCLSVPEEIGKIKERFKGNTGRTVIQIQDVHAHTVAQENIAAILERLRAVFNVDRVALEGAWSTTALSASQAIPSSRDKQLLARSLLEEDLISGPVYAAVLSPGPITLAGIEEEAAYEKNRQIYLDHQGAIPLIKEKIAAYFDRLKHSQKTLWNPGLFTFGNSLAAFRERGDVATYLASAIKTADAHATDLSDLAQISLIREIITLENQVDRSRLKTEIDQLIRKYKNTPYTLEELIRGGMIPEETTGLYPEVKKIRHLTELRDRISISEFQRELEIMTRRIMETLAVNDDESALWDRTGRFYLGQSVLSLQATPDILDAFEKELPAAKEEFAAAGLAKELDRALDFYATVKERDSFFAKKILEGPRFQGTVAVVTGGFHTDGLSRKLREAGVSFITIAPELGDGKVNEELYEKRMAEDLRQGPALNKVQDQARSNADSQTLSELRNRLEIVDERFPVSLGVLSATKNILSAVAVYQGESPAALQSSAAAPNTPARPHRQAAGVPVTPPLSFSIEPFMRAARESQLAEVRAWMEQVGKADARAMLVAEADAMKRLLEDKAGARALKRLLDEGDILALAQNIPSRDLPEDLLFAHGIERFEIKNEDPSLADIEVLLQGTPRFKRFARKYPFVIMKNGYENPTFVVLPESPVSLVLYRLIALNAELCRAAKNAEFLKLLEGLTAEILSRQAAGQAA